MAGDGLLIDVAAAVADGSHVDWPELERQAKDEQQRALLRSLRLLAQVGEVHDTAVREEWSARQGISTGVPAVTRETLPTEAWGRYELRERLGEGAQGAVYRAWDPQLECEVALKVLQPRLAAADRDGERILREGRALARVRHPNVVNIYAAERHRGQIGLCMEFIRGRTLEDVLATQGAFGAQEATGIGVAVGRALAAVHAAGLVHRDVKARNVMREDKGRIVLMDFGTGRDHAQLAGSGSRELAGTPLYMAPEVLSGSTASQQSDVYSVGVLLYHLVSGRYPVEGNTIQEIVQAHMQGRRSPLAERRPDLPEGFIRVIDRAIAPDPVARYENAATLVHDLVALEAGDADQLAPPRTVAQRLLLSVAWLAGAALTLTLLGFINSTTFNVVLERTAVVEESPVEWLIWGLRSLIGPIVSLSQVFIVALVAMFTVSGLWRLAGRRSLALRRWSDRLAAVINDARHVVGIDDPAGFGRLVLILGSAYLVAVFLAYLPLITAIRTPISEMTQEQRALLSPAARPEGQFNYRDVLDYLVVGMTLAFYRLRNLQRRQRTTGNPVYVAGVATILVLATILWNAPYRLLYQAEFPRVEFDGQRCYSFWKNDSEALVYCPDAAEGKVRRRLLSDQRIRDGEVTENIFKVP